MKLKSLINKPDINLEKDKLYEVVDIVCDAYKIKIPKKRKGIFVYALINESEGELIE
jgi:hypothetical protein